MKSNKTSALLLTSALAGGAAHGAIVYTNFNNLTLLGYSTNTAFGPGFGYTPTKFDMTASFNSHYTLLYEDANAQKPEVRGDGTNSFVLARTWQDTNNMDLNDRTYGALPLTPGGVMVNASMTDVNSARQENGVTNMSVQVNGWFNDRDDNTDADQSANDYSHIDYLGDWGQAVTNSGYVGLMMVNGGVTNYGWAHFTWSDPTTSYSDTNVVLTLIDGAYQTTPNTGILTGDGTPGVPTINYIRNSAPTATNYAGASIELAATVSGGLNYQWKAEAVGGGIYTNLTDGGNFSGSMTPNLYISSATPANTADYVLTASNRNGSATSPPTTLTISPVGSTPTSSNGWFQAFQSQADYTYAGGRQNISYKASNGKDYWLFNALAAGTINPANNAFNSIVQTVDNRILVENGDFRAPTTSLSLDGVDAIPGTANEVYQLKDMFEANGRLYVLSQRVDSTLQLSRMGGEFAVFQMRPGGMLQFLRWAPAVGTGQTNNVNDLGTIQWSDSAVVQNDFVYIFGDSQITDTNNNEIPAYFVARVPTINVENTNAWSFWNGSSWDTQETNAAMIMSNEVAISVVRLYKGNWVAIGKPYGTAGNQTFAYTAPQPQGPYSAQYLFTDPGTNAINGEGITTNQATGIPENYYTADPAPHPDYLLTSGSLLVSIGYEGSSYSFWPPDAQLYKPRFYEVTLTNLVPVSSTITIQKVGTNVVVIWSAGTLEQATNIAGPWTTNLAIAPYTNSPSAVQQFYRTVQ